MKTEPLRIERFLHEMDQVVPWQQLEDVIHPYYKGTGGPSAPRPAGDAAHSFSPAVAQFE
ncbi:MAG: hypothetical protein NPIRA02_35460 [Nitrospirales bacterium]|nr:MAG: hypothetical protein NPIRA02_35460 [Nitrospirales bacterium]